MSLLLSSLSYLPQTLQGNSGSVPSVLSTGGLGGFDGLDGFVTGRLTFVVTGMLELLLSELVAGFTLVRLGSGFIKLHMINTKK